VSSLEQQREVLGRVADQIARRRLTAAAIFTLESMRPLSFVASQALVALGPLIEPLLSVRDYGTFYDALEDRRNVDWLINRLEEAENQGGPASG
jgi:hypothetical protein